MGLGSSPRALEAVLLDRRGDHGLAELPASTTVDEFELEAAAALEAAAVRAASAKHRDSLAGAVSRMLMLPLASIPLAARGIVVLVVNWLSNRYEEGSEIRTSWWSRRPIGIGGWISFGLGAEALILPPFLLYRSVLVNSLPFFLWRMLFSNEGSISFARQALADTAIFLATLLLLLSLLSHFFCSSGISSAGSFLDGKTTGLSGLEAAAEL